MDAENSSTPSTTKPKLTKKVTKKKSTTPIAADKRDIQIAELKKEARGLKADVKRLENINNEFVLEADKSNIRIGVLAQDVLEKTALLVISERERTILFRALETYL